MIGHRSIFRSFTSTRGVSSDGVPQQPIPLNNQYSGASSRYPSIPPVRHSSHTSDTTVSKAAWERQSASLLLRSIRPSQARLGISGRIRWRRAARLCTTLGNRVIKVANRVHRLRLREERKLRAATTCVFAAAPARKVLLITRGAKKRRAQDLESEFGTCARTPRFRKPQSRGFPRTSTPGFPNLDDHYICTPAS